MKYNFIIQELKASPDPNVRTFVREVERIERLTSVKRQYYYSHLHEPDAINSLVNDYIPYITRVAYIQSLKTNSVSFLDLVNEGIVGACVSLLRSEERGKAKVARVRACINNYIKRAIEKEEQQFSEEDGPVSFCCGDDVESINENDVINAIDRGRERVLMSNLIYRNLGSRRGGIILEYYLQSDSDVKKVAERFGLTRERVRQIIRNFRQIYKNVDNLWSVFSSDFNLPVNESKFYLKNSNKRKRAKVETSQSKSRDKACKINDLWRIAADSLELAGIITSGFLKSVSSEYGNFFYDYLLKSGICEEEYEGMLILKQKIPKSIPFDWDSITNN
jgi:plasmid maintenance system antidote protein VapI